MGQVQRAVSTVRSRDNAPAFLRGTFSGLPMQIWSRPFRGESVITFEPGLSINN